MKTEKQTKTADGAAHGGVVLVGTYRGDQLKDWPGWYCWPLDKGQGCQCENVASAQSQLPIKAIGKLETGNIGNGNTSTLATLHSVTELWLYRGTADERRYRAEFVGVKTREELILDYGYPGGGVSATKNTKDAKGGSRLSRPPKPHGTHYALFKTELLYRHKNAPQEEADAVVVRLTDFARSPKVRKQLREYLESPDRKDPDLAKLLPSIVTSVPPERLEVCEAGFSAFWGPKDEFPDSVHALRAVELFAGIGGFRIACDNLGIQTIWANDIDHNAVKVYSDNFGTGEIVEGDINDEKGTIPDHDILLAGFPCQPFSKAGKKMGVDDFRGTLFESIVDVLQNKKPSYFVLENVSNLLSLDKGRHFKTVLSALCKIDYHIEWKVFNVASLGLPQHRERIIIVGAKNGDPETSRLLTQAEADSLSSDDAEVAASPFWWKDILSINDILPKWGKAHKGRYCAADFSPEPHIFPARKLKDVLDANPGPEFDFTEDTLKRIASSTFVNKYYNGVQLLFNQGGGARMGYTIFGVEGLAPTLTASSSRHYERYGIGGRYRRLTNLEYAKIQGFPEQHCRAVSVYDQYKLFGNALPPILAEWAIDRLVNRKTSQLPSRTGLLHFG